MQLRALSALLFSLLVASCGAVQVRLAARGVFIAWLRQVKRFVKEAGHADSYRELTVDYIQGHNPDLVILGDDGAELERVDLSAMTTDEIHDLMKAKGFTRSEVEL
ncbi:Sep15/SelM redox domain-containing protein [Pelagophyceae sp. CCMP2097]|nr:Sep15/SelM redox domain-containing protein [Pelagophyceae sp. CCMP2097]